VLVTVLLNVAMVFVVIKLVGVWPAVAIYSLILVLVSVAVARGLRHRAQRTPARPPRQP